MFRLQILESKDVLLYKNMEERYSSITLSFHLMLEIFF